MFSTVVSRFERAPLSNASPSQCLISRSSAGGVTRDFRRVSGRPLLAVAPRKRPLKCAVQSDLTENAAYTADLLNEQPPELPLETPVAEPEPELPSPEPEVDGSFSAATPTQEPTPSETQLERQSGVGDLPFAVKDEVTIRVLARPHSFGVSVRFTDWPSLEGFMPYCLFPFPLMSATLQEMPDEPPRKLVAYSLRRRVKVDSIVQTRTGACRPRPVVSAIHSDKKILWKRLRQIQDLCMRDGEVIRGYVLHRNEGGLLVSVAGYRCFLPKRRCGEAAIRMLTADHKHFQKLARETELDLLVERVEERKERVVVNHLDTDGVMVLRNLNIGDLIHGTVVNMTHYGAFVRIDGTLKSVLLHVRNISQRMVRAAEDVFASGEEIYAVVLDISPCRQRISLGTADLEDEPGEMLYNKERVMQNAPIIAAQLHEELVHAREVHMSETHEDE